MNILPFNKWTLSFENKEYEMLYQIELNKNRLKYFRFFAILSILVSTTIIVIDIINKESVFTIITLALMDVTMFTALLNSHKWEKYMSYLYSFLYITTIGVSIFYATSYFRKSLYIFGFTTSQMTSVTSLLCHYGVRIPLLLIVPPLQMYFLDSYNVEDISIIILIFYSEILFGMYAHHNEYMNRLTFSYTILNHKFKEVIQKYVPQSLFIISQNPRTQQFELQFQNDQSQQFLNIEDTKTMIDFIRSIHVAPKGQITTVSEFQNTNLQKSVDQPLKRGAQKRQTLEEFAFRSIKQNANNRKEFENTKELDGIYFDQKEQQSKQLGIEIKQILYGKNTLLIVIKDEKPAQVFSKDREQIKFLSKIIQYITTKMIVSLQEILKLLNQSASSIQIDKLWKIKCLQLSITNKCENFKVFVNSKDLCQERLKHQQVYLKSFIDNLEHYFINMAILGNKRFILKLEMDDALLKINTKYLSQILINIYEQALNLCDNGSVVKLVISPESNLNPLNGSNVTSRRQTVQGLQFIKKVDNEITESLIHQQGLIQFQFCFQTKDAVDLDPSKKFILNPLNAEEFISNNQQEFSIIYPITKFLLQKIGPYNSIQTSQSQCLSSWSQQQSVIVVSYSDSEVNSQQIYQNCLSFYIYTDSTQLTQSFVRFIRQKSFLDI